GLLFVSRLFLRRQDSNSQDEKRKGAKDTSAGRIHGKPRGVGHSPERFGRQDDDNFFFGELPVFIVNPAILDEEGDLLSLVGVQLAVAGKSAESAEFFFNRRQPGRRVRAQAELLHEPVVRLVMQRPTDYEKRQGHSRWQASF